MTDLQPGRELDALVAEKVMGLTAWCLACKGTGEAVPYSGDASCPECLGFGFEFEPCPYSTDIAAAWSIVERFPHFYLYRWDKYVAPNGKLGAWECRFSESDDGGLCVWAETAPMAICLAALKAAR